MKVLVIGATGFIGLPAAQALVRAGHIVYGLVRSEDKAKMLAAEETPSVINEAVIPIYGDADSEAWVPLIASLDVIIEAMGGGANLPVVSPALFHRVVKAATELRPSGAPLLSYIYTSGTWVHGDDRVNVVTDTRPPEIMKWRPAVEQLVVQSAEVNGIAVRPALLYGRSASLFTPLFEGAKAGKVSWPGTPGGRYALIHADDLAEMYVKVAEKASLVGGKIFDVSSPNTESVDDFLGRLVAVAGAKAPYEYRRPENLYEEALQSTTLLRPYLAEALLGWSPRKPGLVEGLETYYAAWVAGRS
ncbi:hypothetical protein FB45DRAFT_875838 [Roridomyces roridus]|uniref:NAD(P)-binding domain-containing protein n=1 Tax=Roridomyces roridus TaxID=1738132 RepID=A0AAD7B5H2_9AGAR|nr:hypothetical protein FB45DRAFT_875838 [Roridomyces roridus]